MNCCYLRSPGDLIAHYRVRRLLGAGAEGNVYVVVDTRDGSLRTLKLIRGRSMLADVRHTVRYYQRLRTCSSVKQLVDWGTLPGQRGVGERPYLVFEYVRGLNLADCIVAGRVMNPLRLLQAVCDALVPIHRRGLAVGDFDRERNLVVERGTRRIRFVDLDAGTPIDPAPTRVDDLEELARLARRMGRCGTGLGMRLAKRLAAARSLTEARRLIDEAT